MAGILGSYTDTAIGDWITGVSGTMAGVAPGQNIAYYMPIEVTRRVTIYQAVVRNGATVAGNFDVGLYDEWLNRLVSSGSTAQSGTNSSQSVNITDTVLDRGTYYAGFASDSTTATYRIQSSPGLNGATAQACGCMSQASAFPLPDPAVFAGGVPANLNFPHVCFLFWSTLE